MKEWWNQTKICLFNQIRSNFPIRFRDRSTISCNQIPLWIKRKFTMAVLESPKKKMTFFLKNPNFVSKLYFMDGKKSHKKHKTFKICFGAYSNLNMTTSNGRQSQRHAKKWYTILSESIANFCKSKRITNWNDGFDIFVPNELVLIDFKRADIVWSD